MAALNTWRMAGSCGLALLLLASPARAGKCDAEDPCACGDTVVATARVTAVKGGQVTLEFDAHDSRETIAKGKHVRSVVCLQRFKQHFEKKRS